MHFSCVKTNKTFQLCPAQSIHKLSSVHKLKHVFSFTLVALVLRNPMSPSHIHLYYRDLWSTLVWWTLLERPFNPTTTESVGGFNHLYADTHADMPLCWAFWSQFTNKSPNKTQHASIQSYTSIGTTIWRKCLRNPQSNVHGNVTAYTVESSPSSWRVL